VLAEEEAAEQRAVDGTEWLERFPVEHDNLRAALEWLTETGDVEWGFRLGAAMFRFWETREYLAEGRDRLGKLLKMPSGDAKQSTSARAFFRRSTCRGPRRLCAREHINPRQTKVVCVPELCICIAALVHRCYKFIFVQ
jgi:hypothetical protein